MAMLYCLQRMKQNIFDEIISSLFFYVTILVQLDNLSLWWFEMFIAAEHSLSLASQLRPHRSLQI